MSATADRDSIVWAMEALRDTFRDMAREDIDGESGTVTYRQVIGGLDAAIEAVNKLAPVRA